MPNYAVSHQSFIHIELIELFPIEFIVIVSSQAFDLFLFLLLDRSFPLFELPKNIILMLQDIWSDLSQVVINESQYISSTTM